MSADHRAKLAQIKRFDQLIAYLRDEMGWPIGRDSFEEVDDLFYEFTADELGIDPKTAAKIQEIKRLRPLSPKQPWGIFFVKFEPKRLPVVALRRILGQVALKKRASANSAERAAWAADDLLFVSNYGEGDERQISFAHFAQAQDGHDLPTLKVLGWDNRDTALHLDDVARELTAHLAWPEDDANAEAWRSQWRSAFTLGHREVVTTSRELSIRLAELARTIRDRIKSALAIETDKGPLTKLMKAFQASLVHDLEADGFADMYAQTIAYGLLSARIADPHKKTADDFAAHMRTNPFLRELMETFLKIGGRRGKAGGPGIDFDELGVSEVVDLLDDANMEAVVRDFGDRNPQEDPVIHFYELFLKEYDARKRMQRGVFYTPRPVVSYIVRSVDELLRTEFGLADGLADTTTWSEMARRHKNLKIPDGMSPGQDFVQILDPATGTGTFLVEAIDLIHKTLVAKWQAQGHGEKQIDALWNEYVPKHLLTRLHGYELLMAPYAIAHLKIGLKLYETAYRFASDERARVYLTNALEPPSDRQHSLDLLPALAHEARAVNNIKTKRHFTVLLGNPPYSGHSANASRNAEGGLTAIGRLIEDYKQVDGQSINEKQPKLLQDDYVKFLRLASFLVAEKTRSGVVGFITNHSYLDNPTFRGMRQTWMKRFPRLWLYDLHGNSKKGESAPSGLRDENVFEIQQGVAILLASRIAAATPGSGHVRHASAWGSRQTKYEQLSRHSMGNQSWNVLAPSSPFYLFVPQDTSLRDEFERGVRLSELMPLSSIGVVSGREGLTYDLDREPLLHRVTEFCDPRRSDSWVRETFAIRDAGGYELAKRRKLVLGKNAASLIRRLTMRPFDYRWVAFSRGLLTADQFNVMQHLMDGEALGLITTRQTKEPWGAFVTRTVTAHKAVAAYDATSVFPLYLRPDKGSLTGLGQNRVNLAPAALSRLFAAIPGLCGDAKPDDVFGYLYAIFYSPQYRERYSEFLRIDYPRVPSPRNRGLFESLSALGSDLVALHLLESPKLAKTITEFFRGRRPQVEKVSWAQNTVWVNKAQSIGFTGVREEVWKFHIGGYQVCEKWLKDRKGRTLSSDDIAHYHKIVVALSETIRFMKSIDEVIEQHGGWPGAFRTSAAGQEETSPLRKVAEPKGEYGKKD